MKRKDINDYFKLKKTAMFSMVYAKYLSALRVKMERQLQMNGTWQRVG